MIKVLDSGDLYCNRCKRLCDNACYTDCRFYRGFCTTCEHLEDESEYCNECFDGEKWVDRFIHGGIYK